MPYLSKITVDTSKEEETTCIKYLKRLCGNLDTAQKATYNIYFPDSKYYKGSSEVDNKYTTLTVTTENTGVTCNYKQTGTNYFCMPSEKILIGIIATCDETCDQYTEIKDLNFTVSLQYLCPNGDIEPEPLKDPLTNCSITPKSASEVGENIFTIKYNDLSTYCSTRARQEVSSRYLSVTVSNLNDGTCPGYIYRDASTAYYDMNNTQGHTNGGFDVSKQSTVTFYYKTVITERTKDLPDMVTTQYCNWDGFTATGYEDVYEINVEVTAPSTMTGFVASIDFDYDEAYTIADSITSTFISTSGEVLGSFYCGKTSSKNPISVENYAPDVLPDVLSGKYKRDYIESTASYIGGATGPYPTEQPEPIYDENLPYIPNINNTVYYQPLPTTATITSIFYYYDYEKPKEGRKPLGTVTWNNVTSAFPLYKTDFAPATYGGHDLESIQTLVTREDGTPEQYDDLSPQPPMYNPNEKISIVNYVVYSDKL